MRLKYIAISALQMVLASCLIVTGCAEKPDSANQAVTTPVIKDITASEALALIQENQGNPDFTIIDVRTPEEFDEGHLEKARNIDYLSETFRNNIAQQDKDKTYLIYCRSGNRSRGALNVMVELGFRKVYHLTTGIIGWLGEEYPVTR
ncbi:rhodanese-like domain-containing protein [Chloroflexota bacterium]